MKSPELQPVSQPSNAQDTKETKDIQEVPPNTVPPKFEKPKGISANTLKLILGIVADAGGDAVEDCEALYDGDDVDDVDDDDSDD